MAQRSPHANRPGHAFTRADERRYLRAAKRTLLFCGSKPRKKGAFTLNSLGAGLVIGGDLDVLKVGNSLLVGLPDTANNQNLIEIDATNGTLISSRSLFTTANQDDHNGFEVALCDNGALVVFACGHQEGIVVNEKRSPTGSLSGFGSNNPFTAGGLTTYTNNYKSPDTGHLHPYYRVSEEGWEIAESSDNGVTIGTPVKFVDSGGDQMYIKMDRIAPNLMLVLAYISPNVGSPNVRVATLNLSTGDIKSGSGTLGNLGSGGTMPTDLADWSVLYTASGGDVCSVTNVSGEDQAFAMMLARSDQQFTKYYVAHFTGADITSPFSASDWAFELVCKGGFGVGSVPPDSPATPYYRPGKIGISCAPGRSGLQAVLSRQFNGFSKVEQWDRIDGVWLPTRYYAKRALRETDAVFRPISMPSDSVPVAYTDVTYPGYNFWDGDVKSVCINRFASAAPKWLGPLAFSTPEHRIAKIQVLTDQPVNLWVSGGDDAAQFFAFGDELYFKTQDYGAPADLNTDQVYEVQITLMPLVLDPGQAILDGLTTTVALKVAVTDLDGTATALNKYTSDLTHTTGGWVYQGITAPTTTTTEVLDPDGGHTGYKLVRTNAINLNHRAEQALTALLPNTQYEVQGEFRAHNANFVPLGFTDGTTNFGAVFDVLEGEFVAPRSPVGTELGGPIDYAGVKPLANSWFRIRFGATTGSIIGACKMLFGVKSYGGSKFTESQLSTTNLYGRRIMIAQGAGKDFVDRGA